MVGYCITTVFDPCLLFFILPLSTFSGKPSFTKKQADLFFPPDFADDFPVAMQVFLLGVLPFCCSLFAYELSLFLHHYDVSHEFIDLCEC